MPERPWPCRVFPHEVADGPANMARDEALLDLAAAAPDAAAFRTYGWSVPTLSLGYFQSIAEAEADPRWSGVAVVRRPTGGGAIVHDCEVTYALAVPRGHPLARRTGELYRAVHAAVVGVLAESGVESSRRGGAPRAGDTPRPFLCFTDRDPEDVVAGSAKVVGSAQRRRSGAVLQHGSVLLARSPLAPELPGVAEVAPGRTVGPDWPSVLRQRIPAALGFAAVDASWSGDLAARADEIERTVYRNPLWTRRR